MGKVFSTSGYWNDDGTPFDNQLITELDQTPEGYSDEDIFFYGLSEDELMGGQGDFTITSYTVEGE